MAVTLTITRQDGDLGMIRGQAGKARETIKIVGASAAAGDTGTYTPTYVHRNAVILGGQLTITSATETIAGTALTIESNVALGNDTVYAEIEGDF